MEISKNPNDYSAKPPSKSPRLKIPVPHAHQEVMARINKNITVMDHGTHPAATPSHDATPPVPMKPMLPN